MPPNPLTLLTINILIFQFGPLRKKNKSSPCYQERKGKKGGEEKEGQGRGGGEQKKKESTAIPFPSHISKNLTYLAGAFSENEN